MFKSWLSSLWNALKSPARWIGASRGWLGWSLPGKSATIVFVFLLLCVLGLVLAAYFDREGPTTQAISQWRFVIPVAILILAIPIATYYAVQAWMDVEPTQFPDIDEAWNLGWSSILRKGMDPAQCPLLFAYGVSSPSEADQLMQATGWELLVMGEPDGKHPLRWYAKSDAVVVFLLDASSTSIAQRRDAQSELTSAAGGSSAHRGTMMNPVSSAGGGSGTADRGIRGTIVARPETSIRAEPTKPTGIRGTIVVSQAESGGFELPTFASSAAPSKAELIEQGRRLDRVCRLAAKARQPVCPINGTLAVLDWHTLVADRSDLLRSTVADDAGQILEAAQIHAPMAILVSGMEEEAGFIEFARRMGEDQAKNNRVGHKFDHQSLLSVESLERLAASASAVLEGWIYDLFRKPESLGRPNNDRLFSFLCKLRTTIQPRLKSVLASLSGIPKTSEQRGPLLCGCYFGAAGSSRSKQAFVGAVFDKLLEFEEELDWTEEAWRNEKRYQAWFSGLMLLNGLLLVFIIGLMIYFFLR